MKKIILIALLSLFYIIQIKAQDTLKIFFDENWHEVAENSPTIHFIRNITYSPVDSLKNITEYNLNGTIIRKTHSYSDIKKLRKEYFKEDGWSLQYDSLGNLIDKSFYQNKKIQSKTTYYENGNIEDSIIWKYQNHDQHEYILSYHKNGVLERKEYNLNNKLIGGTCYDSLGVECQFVPYYEMPEFPGGTYALNRYLAGVRYPIIAQENGIQGRVYTSFEIDTDGKIINVKTARGVDPLLDKAALDQIQNMPAWKPGKKKGKLVKVSYTVPINFVLTGRSSRKKSSRKKK